MKVAILAVGTEAAPQEDVGSTAQGEGSSRTDGAVATAAALGEGMRGTLAAAVHEDVGIGEAQE